MIASGSPRRKRSRFETTDGMSAWTTVGVSQNIIEASWEALCEAYRYGLIHAEDEAELPAAELAHAASVG